jgi:hypothetical protein
MTRITGAKPEYQPDLRYTRRGDGIQHPFGTAKFVASGCEDVLRPCSGCDATCSSVSVQI